MSSSWIFSWQISLLNSHENGIWLRCIPRPPGCTQTKSGTVKVLSHLSDFRTGAPPCITITLDLLKSLLNPWSPLLIIIDHHHENHHSSTTNNYQPSLLIIINHHYSSSSLIIWLVVLNILNNISQWEGLSHIFWKVKKFHGSKPPIR